MASQKSRAWAAAHDDSEGPLPSFRQGSFTPMSRQAFAPAHETHRDRHLSATGIKPGYQGHVPNACKHFGSSHTGGSHRDFQQTLDAKDAARTEAALAKNRKELKKLADDPGAFSRRRGIPAPDWMQLPRHTTYGSRRVGP